MNLPDIPLLSMLRTRMSWLNQRQDVLTQNVANADTPGYKSQDIDFQQELQRLSEPAGDPAVTETAGQITKSDGNNVNLDREARLGTPRQDATGVWPVRYMS